MIKKTSRRISFRVAKDARRRRNVPSLLVVTMDDSLLTRRSSVGFFVRGPTRYIHPSNGYGGGQRMYSWRGDSMVFGSPIYVSSFDARMKKKHDASFFFSFVRHGSKTILVLASGSFLWNPHPPKTFSACCFRCLPPPMMSSFDSSSVGEVEMIFLVHIP